jgi:cellulose biosynthesis protein BcsQ
VAAEPGLQSVERKFIGDISLFKIGDPLKHPEAAASKWMRRELRALGAQYEFVIFDCPPGISIFAFAGIQNSTTIVVPATPDYLSMLAIRSMHDHALPAALRGRNRKAPLEVKIILNRCLGTANAPATYRKKILTYIKEKNWSAALAAMQIPQTTKMQNAMEAGEDRKWKTFEDKYDKENAAQLLQELGAI